MIDPTQPTQRVYARHTGTLPIGPDVGTLVGEYVDKTICYTYRMIMNGHMHVYKHLVHKNGTVCRVSKSSRPCTNLIVHEFGTTGVARILKNLTGPLRWSE